MTMWRKVLAGALAGAFCLVGLAATTAASGELGPATKLFAASAALLESIGFPLAPADRLALSQDIDALRGRLGDDAWDAAWATGSAMSPEQAVELALAAHADDSAAAGPVAGCRAGDDLQRLSRREREVSRLIAEGLTNRQICQALSISERTVGSHIDHIMTKLNARSRTRIAVWAVEHGMGRPGSAGDTGASG